SVRLDRYFTDRIDRRYGVQSTSQLEVVRYAVEDEIVLARIEAVHVKRCAAGKVTDAIIVALPLHIDAGRQNSHPEEMPALRRQRLQLLLRDQRGDFRGIRLQRRSRA